MMIPLKGVLLPLYKLVQTFITALPFVVHMFTHIACVAQTFPEHDHKELVRNLNQCRDSVKASETARVKSVCIIIHLVYILVSFNTFLTTTCIHNTLFHKPFQH